jgi:hypothetical protein
LKVYAGEAVGEGLDVGAGVLVGAGVPVGVAVGTGDALAVGEAATNEVPVDVGLAVGVGDAACAGCEKLELNGNRAIAITVPLIRVLFQKNRLAFNT